MSHNLALGVSLPTVAGGNLVWVAVVAVVALMALAVAGWLVRDVLAASQGTPKMQEIARRSRKAPLPTCAGSSGPSACLCPDLLRTAAAACH